MAAIVADHAPMLKQAGFRKRRHGFNRAENDGLVHLVHFWMAPKEPPAWTEVPGLRERRYGSFRIDFGVYVPEMTRKGTPRGSWINDYDCQLRETVGRLPTGEWTDFWWRLDDPDASRKAGEALRSVGLRWLDRFPDAAAILEFDRVGPIEIGTHPAGALDVADLCRARGDINRERRVIEQYVAQPVLQSHVEYLRSYLNKHGHDGLIDRITTRSP
jgi:hypothetical protein